MLTDADIKKLLLEMARSFVTKEELRQEFEKIREEMATKDMFREVMTKLDAVFKEVLAVRQEQSVHAQQHSDIHDELDALKKHVGMTHSTP